MRVVIYGSRPNGHARVVLEVLSRHAQLEVVGMIDDLPEHAGREISGLVVLGPAATLARLGEEGVEGVLLGFGGTLGRDRVVASVDAAGLVLPTLLHPLTYVAESATVEDGCQVLPHASIGPGARVGRGVLINTGAIVEHDAAVGDYAVVDPGAVIAGRASIGSSVEIGSRAVVLPDIEIGAGATVGAGAVVTRNVAGGSTVAGVPARAMA